MEGACPTVAATIRGRITKCPRNTLSMRARFRHKSGMAKTKSISVPGSWHCSTSGLPRSAIVGLRCSPKIEAEKAGI